MTGWRGNHETLEYVNHPDYKKLKVGFTIADMFEITAFYELKKINETKTHLKYTTTNRPLKWYMKIFLMFRSDKVVAEFLERVKQVAETDQSN